MSTSSDTQDQVTETPVSSPGTDLASTGVSVSTGPNVGEFFDNMVDSQTGNAAELETIAEALKPSAQIGEPKKESVTEEPKPVETEEDEEAVEEDVVPVRRDAWKSMMDRNEAMLAALQKAGIAVPEFDKTAEPTQEPVAKVEEKPVTPKQEAGPVRQEDQFVDLDVITPDEHNVMLSGDPESFITGLRSVIARNNQQLAESFAQATNDWLNRNLPVLVSQQIERQGPFMAAAEAVLDAMPELSEYPSILRSGIAESAKALHGRVTSKTLSAAAIDYMTKQFGKAAAISKGKPVDLTTTSRRAPITNITNARATRPAKSSPQPVDPTEQALREVAQLHDRESSDMFELKR